jgi:glycosyltransferase involved in cell wall biosynthesis
VRIGLDLLYLIPGVVGGTETYARGLLTGLAAVGRRHEYVVFVNEEAADWPLPAGPFTRVVCPVRAESRAARYAFGQMRLLLWVRERGLDVLHSPGYVGPLLAPCPLVLTVHDANWLALARGLPLSKRLFLGPMTRLSMKRARVVLTVSEFSRSELLNRTGVSPEKVWVTHEVADARPSARPARGGGAPYFTAFSSASPNKNIPFLLKAFEKARALGVEHDLVLIGHRPASGFGRVSAGVRFTGWLPDDRRDAVVAGADALVFPSLYEGFGLPVLEAMAAGVPVLSSNRASLPEVGGDAAEYFDPENVEEMAVKISTLAADRRARERMREAGFRNVACFSWEKTAAATLNAYEQALASWSRPRPRPASSARGFAVTSA